MPCQGKDNDAGQLLHHEVSDPLLHWSPAGTGTTTYAANGLNQYTTIAAASLAHDANGNSTRDHGGRDYAYDAQNRLLQVRATPGGTVLATFAYNADDTRRYSSDGLNTYYHGDQAILDMDAAGGNNYALNRKLRRYVRLPGAVDEALLMITYNSSGTETGRQYAHFNRLGSTVAVSNAAGAITDRFK